MKMDHLWIISILLLVTETNGANFTLKMNSTIESEVGQNINLQITMNNLQVVNQSEYLPQEVNFSHTSDFFDELNVYFKDIIILNSTSTIFRFSSSPIHKIGSTDFKLSFRINTINEKFILKGRIIAIRPYYEQRAYVIRTLLTTCTGMLSLFLVGCLATSTAMCKALCWAISLLLLQSIVVPMVLFAITEILRIDGGSQLGILATITSPCSVTAVAMTFLIGGDVIMTSLVLIGSFFVSLMSMPAWASQFNMLGSEALLPRATPYLILPILAIVATVCFIAGMMVKSRHPNTALRISGLLPFLSILLTIHQMISLGLSGQSLFPSLSVNMVTAPLIWSIILFIINIGIALCLRMQDLVPLSKFSAVFMSIISREDFIAQMMVQNSLPNPDEDVATCSSFGFVFVTRSVCVVLIVIHFVWILVQYHRKDMDGVLAFIVVDEDNEVEEQEVIEASSEQQVQDSEDHENNNSVFLALHYPWI